ncbi:nickel pincer cofactor biosynthesis protein LarC [Candidatus Sumerlaeota bacterium]|nr:nickel pincer cofactor biosynthesis protein LarC [Candidatus Sumerlaeota bacterium]
MTHLHFDCASGVAGDMILGGLVDAGGDFEGLTAALKTLALSGWRIEREEVRRGGIAGTLIRVIAGDGEPPHRHLPQIERSIGESGLAPRARERAIAAFRLLAEAEGAVHRTAPERVHFHEVGAVDAIIDICGAMHLATEMGVETASASSINVGSGTVECEHGTIPVPAPATAELLRGVPTHSDGPAVELATPTGAAIVRTLATQFGTQPRMRVEAIGCGAGTKEFPHRANLLRVFLGEREGAAESLPVESRTLLVITAEIDDMTPEMLAPVIERGLGAGALDVNIAPIQMKKGRPGWRLTALVAPESRGAVLELLFRETSSFGFRVQEVERVCLHRRFESVTTPWGEVAVKVGLWGEDVLRATPEFEDCRRLAETSGVPLPDVFAAAQAAIHARFGDHA